MCIRDRPHTAQDSIPFERMYKDGICRLANGRYSKCIEFEDINYQLAQPDDKTAIFEALCDMYNSFDASISVQLSLISRHANKDDFKNSITIAPQNDDFDSIRAEYTETVSYTHLRKGRSLSVGPCMGNGAAATMWGTPRPERGEGSSGYLRTLK